MNNFSEQIEKILDDFAIDIDTKQYQLMLQEYKTKIIQLFNDTIDSATHDVYLYLIPGTGISANKIRDIIKAKVGKDVNKTE